MFLNLDGSPLLQPLVDGWKDIRAELISLEQAQFAAWKEKHIYNHGWTTFILYDGYKRNNKQRVGPNSTLCPATMRILDSVPGVLTAGFSSLGPHTRIRPHRGFDKHVLRVHLGLIVPPQCGLIVAGALRRWREGECLAFDDTYVHEAWNESDRRRVVLLVDIKLDSPPGIYFGSSARQARRPTEKFRRLTQWVRFSALRIYQLARRV